MDAQDALAAWQFAPRNIAQPVARFEDRPVRIPAMRVDVHPRKIGNEALVSIGLDIENKEPFVLLRLAAIALGAKENTKFQRHVETGQAVCLVQFGAREIVNPVPAFGDDTIELFEPRLPAIVEFARRPGPEPAGIEDEDQRPECGGIRLIERAVDENVTYGRAIVRRQVTSSWKGRF